MHRYPFIFSNKRNYRFRRHFVFWLCWTVFAAVIYGFTPVLKTIPTGERFLHSGIESVFFLVPHMFTAYTLMYFVIPNFIVKQKYALGFLSVLVIFFSAGFISALIAVYVLDPFREYMYPHWGPVILGRLHHNSIWLAQLAGLRGGITIGGMAAAIKLMKYWYVKEQNNLQLMKENAEAQLQIPKAQVHPHFLFNTLNNIYSHTQGSSPTASKLVMGLSDLLRYMLYDCNQTLVPLEKEIRMVNDYITLERIRYGNNLDVHLEIPENTKDLMIAPLILLPFVENCFKHGASHILDQPWLSMNISLDKDEMKMKLVNGKAPGFVPKNESCGIGISNVKKRLDLLYSGKYNLNIQDEEEVFVVNLKLHLERRPVMEQKKQMEQKMILQTAHA